MVGSGPIDGWSTLSSPVGATAVFSDSGSLNTSVTVSQYGTYQFRFTACESNDVTTVVFAPDEPFILAPDHQDCIFEADLIAYTKLKMVVREPNIWRTSVIFEDPFSPQTVVASKLWYLYF